MRYFTVLVSLLFVIACTSKLERLQESSLPGNFTNVLIDSQNIVGTFNPSEPSIFISPANDKVMVAAAILNRTYNSGDGGRTWSVKFVESPYGVYGDPVITADKSGRFFYAHLSDPEGTGRQSDKWLDRIVIQRSDDAGANWSDGSYAGLNHPADQDKHWLVADPISENLYLTWTEFDHYGSTDPNDKSRILFSRSVDHGLSWSDPLKLSALEGNCLDGDKTTEGAVPAVGPEGEIYVSWSYDDKIYFDRSLDEGISWLENDIEVGDHPGGWSVNIPGLSRANTMPITGCDISNSDFRGNIYINYCDQSSGPDDTDVWLVRSRDGGDTWDEPVRVNTDQSGKHQFFTWMSIDPSSGGIFIVFYDRRDHDDLKTDVYLAYSFDGGQSFENVRISERPFIPNPAVFLGDYNNICALNGKVRPIWTRMDDNKTSIWTAIIDF